MVSYLLYALSHEFLGEDFRPEYLEWVANVTEKDYYIRMMIAWFFATALAKKYEESVIFIEDRRLDSWTHKKAIWKRKVAGKSDPLWKYRKAGARRTVRNGFRTPAVFDASAVTRPGFRLFLPILPDLSPFFCFLIMTGKTPVSAHLN